jgi:phosphoribosylglycinamide formyltransferase-1
VRSDSTEPLRIGIFVSGHGRGSNMQAIIDSCKNGDIHGGAELVVGTRSDAEAITRAQEAGVETVIISPKKYEGDDPAYGEALLNALRKRNVELICLAGYMRILPLNVVDAYRGRIMNIHPALLPLFGGKGMYGENVHRAVIESGMKVSGCTVHFVDEHYDSGPIILQDTVPVLDEDTPETLAARILPVEHRSYSRAVQLFAEGRLRIEDRRVRVSGGIDV